MEKWFGSIFRKIRTRLFIALSVICLSGMAAVSLAFYWQFEKALTERILWQLTSIRHLKQYQIEQYFTERWADFRDTSKQFHITEGEILLQNPSQSDLLKVFSEVPTDYSRPGIYDWTDVSKDGHLHVGFVKVVEGEIQLLILDDTEIQAILLERTGMGETGESYLVGSDFRLRSQSRFFPEKAAYMLSCETVGVRAALAGEAGKGVYPDYRGIHVFGAYDRLAIEGISWAILSEIDESEALAPLKDLRLILLLIFGVATVVVMVISFSLSSLMVAPIHRIKAVLSEMALGKQVLPVPTQLGSEEFAQMFAALNSLILSLNEAIDFAQSIGAGRFDRGYKLLSDDDALGSALVRMRDDLVAFQEREERYKLAVQRSLVEGQENERKRLARDLHDGLGPFLTTLRMSISMVSLEQKDKDTLKSQLDETIAEVRRMTANLMPQSLIDFGVGAALNTWIEKLKASTGIEIIYKNDLLENSRLTVPIHIGLYRVAQESINNALKHAQATSIKVSLTEFEDKVSYFLSDNGKGFDTDAPSTGLGMLNMKERVRLLGGTFYIESSPEGTRVEVEIPLSDD